MIKYNKLSLNIKDWNMKQVCDRREAEIIENLDSLIGTLSLEGIECDITILEQEQMLENIKKS